MIFRRSSDTPASKNSLNTTNRSQSTSQTRREPELSRNAYQPGMTPTAPSAATQPLSPIAMAQSRRPAASTNPMAHFNRQEQMRKLTVGRDISLNGEIATCDHLIVEGNVKATIKGGQMLEISESGAFSGVVDIDQAEIAGIFEGDLIVRNKLILRPTANVSGTIRYGSLQVDTGATLNGEIGALQAAMQNTTQQPQSFAQQQSTNNTAADQQNNYDLATMLNQPGYLKASA